MMKNKLAFLIFLGLSTSQSTLANSLEDSLFLAQLDSGMGHIKVVGSGSGDLSPGHGVISGFSRPSSSLIFGQLFTPSQVMRHQDKLNLSKDQLDSIKKEMRAFQSGIVDIQWELSADQVILKKELGEDSIDLDKTLSLMDRVLEAEGKLKKTHLGLLIKIRNVLNKEQINTLKSRPPFPFGPMGMPPMGMGGMMIEGVSVE